MRSDRARYLSDKITELFTEFLKKPRKEEWKEYMTVKKSTKDEEKYDSIGTISAAEEKAEGGDFHYEQVKQMYQTTVINKTYDRGFYDTMEAVEDDPEKVISKINMGGLMRAMIVKREKNCAAVVDGVFTATGADGVAYAANNHPLDTTKTALVNNNLMSAGAITPDNVIAGCNMFNSIYDYAGNMFDTEATAILAHKNRAATVNAVLQSNLKALESSNTTNTVPMLKAKFGKYINQWYWHLIDENLDSFIFQSRRGLQELSERDRIKNGNYYWNMNERYRAAQINPGFGHVSNAYTGS